MARERFKFIENMIQLQSCDIFSDLAPSELRRIGSIVKEYLCKEGDIILKNGDRQEDIFIVVEGELEMRQQREDGYIPLGYKEIGELLGETALFINDYTAPFTVVSTEASKLLAINKYNFLDLLKENPSISIKLLEHFAQRVERHEDDMERVTRRKMELFDF